MTQRAQLTALKGQLANAEEIADQFRRADSAVHQEKATMATLVQQLTTEVQEKNGAFFAQRREYGQRILTLENEVADQVYRVSKEVES